MQGNDAMKTTDKKELRRQIIDAYIKKLRLIDDEFMCVCFEDNIPGTELMLKVILNRELRVSQVKTQVELKNLYGRRVKLDIHAKDEIGAEYNIEIQRESKGAGAKRARYHSSLLDANNLAVGEDFDSLPETYVIFITERDVLKLRKPIYFIERTIVNTAESIFFNDGSHIVYVNGEIKDDTPLGQLMHDFYCENPNDMNYSELAERVRYFKQEGKEHKSMSPITQEFLAQMRELMIDDIRDEMRDEVRSEVRDEVRNEVRDEVRNEVRDEVSKATLAGATKRMLSDGKLSPEKIAEYLGTTVDEVKALARESATA